MANNAFPYTDRLAAFQAADDAWSAELQRVYGNHGPCYYRYTERGRGHEGSKLRELHDAREAARVAWHQSAY